MLISNRDILSSFCRDGPISSCVEILVQKRVVAYSNQITAFEDFILTSVLDSYNSIGAVSVEM